MIRVQKRALYYVVPVVRRAFLQQHLDSSLFPKIAVTHLKLDVHLQLEGALVNIADDRFLSMFRLCRRRLPVERIFPVICTWGIRHRGYNLPLFMFYLRVQGLDSRGKEAECLEEEKVNKKGTLTSPAAASLARR